MPYVDYMKQIIKKVEKTRRKRIEESREGIHHPRIPQEEVDGFLTKYHPDYMEGTKRPISIGPNKGDTVTNEVADILEAGSMIDPGTFDTSSPDYETDVFIVVNDKYFWHVRSFHFVQDNCIPRPIVTTPSKPVNF